MYSRAALKFALLTQLASLASATYSDPKVLDACPGYQAKNVFNYGHKLTADLVLGGTPCNVFGNDTEKLKLEVTYENSELFSHIPFLLPDSLNLARIRGPYPRQDHRPRNQQV